MKQDRWAFLSSLPTDLRQRLDAIIRHPDVAKRFGLVPEDPQEFAAWVQRLLRSNQERQEPRHPATEEQLWQSLVSHYLNGLTMRIDLVEAQSSALARLLFKEGRITEAELDREMSKVEAERAAGIQVEQAVNPVFRQVAEALEAVRLWDALQQAFPDDEDGDVSQTGKEDAG